MRILIIEDNEKLALSLKRGLMHHGYAVDCLYDGDNGYKRLEISHVDYDVVILDLMLPGKNGIDICRELRQKGISIPILMLTAKDAIYDKIAGLDHGADDYLTKPFAFDELLSRLRALLRRPKPLQSVELQTGPLRLNTATMKVYRDSKEIILTLKEFMLLEYLMRHPNEALSRERLLDHAWDFAFNSFSNVVDVHMKNLRKKVDGNTRHEKLFETVRGIGYRLKA